MAIYAPNGIGKSSLGKCLERWSHGEKPEDLFNPENSPESVFELVTDPEEFIPRQNVFCFKSMPELEGRRFFDDELLASPELKKRYLEFVQRHREQTEVLLESIREKFVSGKSAPTIGEMEKYIYSATDTEDLYDAIEMLLERSSSFDAPAFIQNMKIDKLLNKGSEDKLRKEAVKSSIEIYSSTTDDMLKTSGLFRDGFDYSTANTLLTALEKSHFFTAGHSIVFRDQIAGKDLPITSVEGMRSILDGEFDKVADDPSVKEAYRSVEKALGVAKDTEILKDILRDPEIARAVKDIDLMKLDYLTFAVGECRSAVETFLDGRKEYKTTAKEIQQKVHSEKTGWDHTIELFNSRFNMPFKPIVENRTNVVMGDVEPIIKFEYENRLTDTKLLQDNLSDGERKALYMLSVIFEVEQIRTTNEPKLLVFDDVVDSFDYANKYAFIEYLREFADKSNNYILLLTHNYDFFRTVTNRLESFKRSNCVIAEKDDARVLSFSPVDFINKSPFQMWKEKIDEDEYKIAAIPMVRELVAIRDGSDNGDYKYLSTVLHGRDNTIKFGDLDDCFHRHWDCDSLKSDDRSVVKTIFETCSKIAGCENGRRLALHEKIVLSLGISISVENFITGMYQSAGQTMPEYSKLGKLIAHFKKEFEKSYLDHADIIEQANLITHENIHINSFMYEPLVDIGSQRFIKLYRDCVSSLNFE